jgi:hypothetical protein
MASISLSVPALPPVPQALNVAAAAPVALLAADHGAPPLPFSQSLPAAAPAAAAETGQDGAAMRPDQVFMARQMVFPAADATSLAGTWRAMVRTYGAQLATRDQQARAGQLAPTLLAAAQDGRAGRPPEGPGILPDAWRFTVHAGGPQAQHLQVVADEAEQPPGRRRRARAALRLELELADGTRIMVQLEPVPGGVALELCAPDARALARLADMQPALEEAIGRAGVRVVRWKFSDSLPAGQVHATLLPEEAANALNLTVFRALAELALLLPAGPELLSPQTGQPPRG